MYPLFFAFRVERHQNSERLKTNNKRRTTVRAVPLSEKQIMTQVLADNPWLILCLAGVAVPICGIVFGTITSYLQKTRQAELDASLKHEMLQRGMSADEIVQVLNASSANASRGYSASGHAAK
jgi:hypothetical protein